MTAISEHDVERVDAYWRAANYLSVGQIYLFDNPLLRRPLTRDDIKPRLLGHWGTTPGLNFIWAHADRQIKARDLDAIMICGPGHGGPAAVANAYLEGTWSERYSSAEMDEDGLRKLFRSFSYPGGIGSHVTPEVPGSIHEGGELGYSLAHAYGAAFDNPRLVVFCVVGDGEAETGPLAGSWHSNKFLSPARDGAVLPILHLNGYKIANPSFLARIPESELRALFEGYGFRPLFVSGDEPAPMHREFAAALDEALDDIAAIQKSARGARAGRAGHSVKRAAWPMIVLRTPKGWTGPKVVDGKPVEGTWRAHQVPLDAVRDKPEHLAQLEAWQRRLSLVKRLTGVNLGCLLFRKVHQALGGRLRFLVSGGAALNPQTARDFMSLGLPLLQGWGMTEASPVIALQRFSAARFRFTRYYEGHIGSVGPAVPGVEVRLIDVPEKGIRVGASGEGEVIVRGANIFEGYWDAPEATAEAKVDGWLRTGDLGRIDKDGNIYLTGRSKYVIVLESGEKVHPDELEDKLRESPLLADICVLGRKIGEKTQVTALVYPDVEAAQAAGAATDEAALRRQVAAEIDRLGKQLAAYKRISRIELTDEPLPKTAMQKVARGRLATEYAFSFEKWQVSIEA